VISVLLPTRGRAHLLPTSVGSLLETAWRPDLVQLCYGVDEDDADTRRVLPTFTRAHDNVVITPRHGYAGLHHYVNALAERALGERLFLWNDDAVMLTQVWDIVATGFPNEYVLDCWSNHQPTTCAFPIVPTHWVRHIGHFSLNAHNDTWWQEIGERLHRLVRIDVDVLHRRFDLTGDNNDLTYQEKVRQHQTADFYTEANMNLIGADAAAIMRHLVNQRDERVRGTR